MIECCFRDERGSRADRFEAVSSHTTLVGEARMQEDKSTVFDLERQISVVAVQIKQQQRLVESLGNGLDRLHALSVYADLLRAEYDLESHRARLKKQLSAYSLSGAPGGT